MIKHAEMPQDHSHSTKKEWVIIGILLSILLVVGGFTLFSCYAWQKYENDYKSWHLDLRGQTERALKLPSKTLADRTEKLTTLQSLRYTAANGVNHCNAYQILHWQQGIDAVRQKLNKCQLLAGPAKQFAIDLQAITDHLASEKTISAILVDVKMGDQIEEAKWSEVTAHWDKIVKQLETQNVATTFVSSKKLAIEKVTLVTKAWRALIDANNAKDRSKYEVAVQDLTASYDGLAEIGGSAEKTLLPLLEKLRKSHEQSFVKTTSI